MERIFYLGGATAASFLSVAPAHNPMIWAWLLIAAEAAVCLLLRRQSQGKTKLVPVPAKSRRPIRRAPPHALWR